MQKNPHSNRHAAYRIVPCNDRYLVFDRQGKHRCNFQTQAEAEAWIEARRQRQYPRQRRGDVDPEDVDRLQR